ncbi:MAG: S41 family peptidase [Bacteroidales bacterium]|nr:S41 family peptidase [Bacteroidales bacterium]
MSEKRISSVWVAVLGVALGALLVLTVQKVSENSRRLNARYQDWRKLNLILEKVDEMYVDTVDHKSVTDAAVTAALSKLDPHSVYMPPAELEESETDLAGNFDGIGIQFNVPNDTAIVLEVIPGGPSEKIGMLPGDRLLSVDDKVIAGVKFPQDSMVRRMKGPAGTKVTVTVLRDGVQIPFEITRGKIPVHCVDAAFMVDDKTGYIRLSKFSRTTYSEVVNASIELLTQGMTHLIFDIRDNTGGYFDQALLLSNLFLGRGDLIVYMEGLHRKREEYKADGKGIMRLTKLTVLINESSASSSEIFAGAIQDNDRGVIIGRRSYGKGLVQEPVYFTDGSGVRLTVARFYTPSGRCIQKPYSDDYQYDIIKRYNDGEMTDADSIKVDKSELFYTRGGRKVYGGGGIIPDVFVPMDTTLATQFYVDCNRKATPMRFASDYFDKHKAELSSIDDYDKLLKYLDSSSIESRFLSFAKAKDGLAPASGAEWEETKTYLMPQVKALVGRYSKLGDNAFYHLYLDVDDTFEEAMKPHEIVTVR